MCSDPLVEKLREQGYNPVRLPRADIQPLQLLAKSGRDLSRLGPIEAVLKSVTEPLPHLHENIPAAKIDVRRSGFLKAGLGLSVLGSFFGSPQELVKTSKYRRFREMAFLGTLGS
jgi:hypothetical protein